MATRIQKQHLIELLHEMQQRLTNFQYEQRLEDVTQLKAAIEEDQILVVTVGEFNNGKSTFVNALLNEELLPMGIIPTGNDKYACTWGKKENCSFISRMVLWSDCRCSLTIWKRI